MSTTDTVLPPENAHDPQQCWAVLERVVSSAHLKRAARLKELLIYVGQRAVKDGCDHLPEQEIGVRVFGRPEAYDNANDNIVRTNISELRKRIDAYFAAEGRDEPLIMEIPRGSYIPVFRARLQQDEPSETPPLSAEGAILSTESGGKTSEKIAGQSRWVISTLVALLILACLGLWMEHRAAQQALHPWKAQPAVSALWTNFLANGRTTDVVLEDSSFLLVQDLRHQTISLSDYLTGAYLQSPAGPSMDTGSLNLQRHIAAKILGRASDFQLALDLRALDPLDPSLHFYNARQYSPNLLQQDNLVLLGNPTSNPWYQVFENQLNFTEVANTYGVSVVTNRSPHAGEKSIYGVGQTMLSYCAVAYLPKPDRAGNVLLIQGTTSEATQAGGEFLLSESALANLLAQWNVTQPPYFEVLLRVSHVQGAPLTAQVEAYRTYPNLH